MTITIRGCGRSSCSVITIDLDPEGKIKGPVGYAAVNMARDVRTIQAMLNGVDPAAGGPVELLSVDGIVGPLTTAAIETFQNFYLGWSDKRIDPNGQTIKILLNPESRLVVEIWSAKSSSISGAVGSKNPLPQPPRQKAFRQWLRMQRAGWFWPNAQKAISKATHFLNTAIMQAQVSGNLSSNIVIKHVDKHFKTGVLHSSSLLSDLLFIKGIFNNMNLMASGRRGAFGGTPYGVGIFDIDRFPNLSSAHNWAAYTNIGSMKVPSNVVDRRDPNWPVMGSTAYLCDDMDKENDDFLVAIMIHEMAHMAGEMNGASAIVDNGYADQGHYSKLSKQQRMHNAENYACYAFELGFGTGRLKSFYRSNSEFDQDPQVHGGTLQNRAIEF